MLRSAVASTTMTSVLAAIVLRLSARSWVAGLLAVIASAAACPQASAADVVERIPGRVAAGYEANVRSTRFDELWALNFPAAATIRVTCSGRRCKMRTIRAAVPASGLVNLAARMRKRRLPAGASLIVRASLPGVGYKETRYRLRRKALPVVRRSCQFSIALPGTDSERLPCKLPAASRRGRLVLPRSGPAP